MLSMLGLNLWYFGNPPLGTPATSSLRHVDHCMCTPQIHKAGSSTYHEGHRILIGSQHG